MMSKIKKIAGAMMVFLLIGTTTTFAQEKGQKVTDAELTQFAAVFNRLQIANDYAQQQMVKVVESNGLTMERFNEIHVAYVNPNMESNATKEELKKHDEAMAQIERMQQKLQTEMDAIVKNSGLTTKKYQVIAADMQENMQLRERYKKVAQAKKQ